MAPEVAVEELLRSLRFGYATHSADLPGRPDFVFAGRRKVVFVHGCFWHMHTSKRCPRRPRLPKSNLQYWAQKLERNLRRDRRVQRQLQRQGWAVLTVWECHVRDREALRTRLKRFLSRR